MSIFDDFGAPTFGIADLKIAVWNGTGSYGTALDVPSVQLLDVGPETVSAELEGDDRITATHAQIISSTLTFRFGSVDLDVIELLTGTTITDYGTTPNRIRNLPIDNLNFPYIGLVGKAVAVEGIGDLHIYVRKCKVLEGFNIRQEYGNFAIPELTLKAVADGTNRILEFIEHETAAAVVIPPVYS